MNIAELTTEWLPIARRIVQHKYDEWLWDLRPEEVRSIPEMRERGSLETAQARDKDGVMRLLARRR